MVKETKIIQIGNSKGVRIPKTMLTKYDLQDEIVLEEREDGILIHSKNTRKLSWENTYKAMNQEQEDWSDWQGMDDGWDDLD